MLYMILERFHDPAAVYRRLAERGRMLPPGLVYLDSWVDPSHTRCFQLMECDDPSLLEEWMRQWADLVELEVVPVVSSRIAQAAYETKS